MGDIIKAAGTLLQHGVGTGPIVYTTIAGRVSIDGPDASVAEIDTTDLDSTAMEYDAGLPDLGEVSCTVNYKPGGTTHQLLLDKLLSPVLEPWQIVLSDGTKFPFEAFLKKFKATGIEVNGKVQAEISLRLSGTMVPDYP